VRILIVECDSSEERTESRALEEILMSFRFQKREETFSRRKKTI